MWLTNFVVRLSEHMVTSSKRKYLMHITQSLLSPNFSNELGPFMSGSQPGAIYKSGSGLP